MLIWIDSSVLTADLSQDKNACSGITEIFSTAYRGEHFVLAARKTLASLAADVNLAAVTKTTIARIESNLSILGNVESQIATRVDVTYGMATRPTKTAENRWEVPLSQIGIVGTKKSVLLTENLDDARAYEHAARQYQVSLRLGGYIALEKAAGGGSTTSEVFENLVQQENKWCLCITDTDRFCPEENMGPTSQKCNNIAQGTGIVAKHIDIKVRELENTIPLAFLEKAVPVTHSDLWAWHIKKLYSTRQEAHFYGDLKSGITIKKLISYEKGTPRRNFWESVLADLGPAPALDIACAEMPDCRKNNQCLTPGEPCSCYIFPGFGEHLIDSVLSILGENSPHKSEERTRRDPHRQIWMDIGRLVFEWAYAPDMTRL